MQIRMPVKPTLEDMNEVQLKNLLATIRATKSIVPGIPQADITIDSEEPRVVLVMSYLKKNTLARRFASAEAVEAKKLCDEVLKQQPENNFFNLARAALEADREQQKKFLQKAAISTTPYGNDISAQAAYQLTKIFDVATVDKTMPYIYIEAWFARALMLGEPEATKHFCEYGLYQDGMTSSTTLQNCQPLFTSFLAVILTGKKINGFDESKLLTTKCETAGVLNPSPLRLAHELTDPLSQLPIVGSDVNRVANTAISLGSAEYFCNFFRYCFDAQIVSKDVYAGVLKYISECGRRVEPKVLEQVESESVRIEPPADLLGGAVKATSSASLLGDFGLLPPPAVAPVPASQPAPSQQTPTSLL